MAPRSCLVLDFGSQTTQLITRVVREQQVYSLQLPWDTGKDEFEALSPGGVILSGGPASIYDPGAPFLPEYLLDLEVPILGICYGMQALADGLGGKTGPSDAREYGHTTISVADQNPLIPQGRHQVWMSHGDLITNLPPGFIQIASSENTPLAAMADLSRNIFGVQFHPEVKHTPIGVELIRNFLFKICRLEPVWTAGSIVDLSVREIQKQVGNHGVLAAVSGGVDSSVAAALVHRAVGEQLDAVFVDTGLLREGEKGQVQSALGETLKIRLHTIDAANEFFRELKGVTDPEEKRSRIGRLFIRIFEEQARLIGKKAYLVQGTIYPDVVESAAPDRSQSQTIKTHHNVGGLPEKMDLELVEPLRYLFKDEIRRLGLKLGLPESLVWRQPFPGPGLAIRCLGEVTPERIRRLRQADAIYLQELADNNLLVFDSAAPGQGSSQAFAVLLPVKTVGVMGDKRTYQDLLALRAVTTEDFMTADWSRLPAELLARISNRIVNEVEGINRVVYDITSKPPGTIEWE